MVQEAFRLRILHVMQVSGSVHVTFCSCTRSYADACEQLSESAIVRT